MPFPLIKLAYLAVRQISKPVSNNIKERAKKSPKLRTYICIPAGQFFHRIETIMKLWVMGLGRPVQITPLTEQMAIDLGADILGEVIVFGTAASLAMLEYARSSISARQKEAVFINRIDELEKHIVNVKQEIEEQSQKIRELQRVVTDNSTSKLPFGKLFRSKSEHLSEHAKDPPTQPISTVDSSTHRTRVTIPRSAVITDEIDCDSAASSDSSGLRATIGSDTGIVPDSSNAVGAKSSASVVLIETGLATSQTAKQTDPGATTTEKVNSKVLDNAPVETGSG